MRKIVLPAAAVAVTSISTAPETVSPVAGWLIETVGVPGVPVTVIVAFALWLIPPEVPVTLKLAPEVISALDDALSVRVEPLPAVTFAGEKLDVTPEGRLLVV